MTPRTWTSALAVCAALAAPHLAFATGFPVSDIIANFNAVTLGDYNQGSSDTQGPVIAGGTVTSGAIDDNATHPLTGFTGFTGYGDVDAYRNADVLNANNASVYAGGTVRGASGASSVEQHYAFPTPISDFFAPFQTLSSSLAALPGTTIGSLPMNNAVLEPTASEITTIDGVTVAVLDVTGAVLDESHGFGVNPNGADLVVVNVNDPGDFNYDYSTNDNGGGLQHTLFNFYDATGVGVQNWEGTILAPGAQVGGASAIEGSVIADSVMTAGELHFFPLLGSGAFLNQESGGSSPVGPSPVPEPASLILLGPALAGLAWARRRRRV